MIYRTDIILNSVFVPSWEPHRAVVKALMGIEILWFKSQVYSVPMVELRKPDTLSVYWKTSFAAKRAMTVCQDYTCVRTSRVQQVDYLLFDNYIKYSLASSAMREVEEREGVLA